MEIGYTVVEGVLDELELTPEWMIDAQCSKEGVDPHDIDGMLEVCARCPVLKLCSLDVLKTLRHAKVKSKVVAGGVQVY